MLGLVFSMHKVKGASCYGQYLEETLGYGDYIAEENRVIGQWFGRLTEAFQVSGEVRPSDPAFHSLINGRHPLTGDRLGQRAKSDDAVRLFDFECSAQKSVSLLALTLGDTRLLQAHDRAVRLALTELEQLAAVRVRSGASAWSNDRALTGQLCATLWRHETSRALDPQLHTHCAVFNVSQTEEGRFLALETQEMVRAIRYAGKVYQSEMALAVRRLGYEIELTIEKGQAKGFEIVGVSREIQERFSKRREVIEGEMAKFQHGHGREPTTEELANLRKWFSESSASLSDSDLAKRFREGWGRQASTAEVDIITRQTRETKALAEIPKSRVLELQRAQLSPEERSGLEDLVASAQRRAQLRLVPVSEKLAEDASKQAVDHLFERASVLPHHAVLAESLNQCLGQATLREVARHCDDGRHGLVRMLERRDLTTPFSTRVTIERERFAIERVNASLGHVPPLLSPENFDAMLADVETRLPHPLRQDQQLAAKLICCSPDRYLSVRGVAGAGKSYLLQAVDRLLGESEHRLVYVAPTASAAAVLRQDGLEATTCADFLLRPGDLRHALVICDEAGLQSSKDGLAMIQMIYGQGARMAFVGDTRQHGSVEAGDFLRVLESYSNMRSVEVGQIERQKHVAYRKAVQDLAAGRALPGLERLDALGWVHDAGAEYLAKAAIAFLERTSGGSALEKCLAVAPTWAENHVLTEEIRHGLRAQGRLGEGRVMEVFESLSWTAAQKRDPTLYEPGQRVSFVRPFHGLAKGAVAEVIQADATKVLLQVGDRRLPLPTHRPSRFEVGLAREIEVAVGDRLLIRANERKLGLINGQLLRVAALGEDGQIHTQEGPSIPRAFRQFLHGYAVTSHKAQGSTFDHVVVATGHRFDAKAAYVSLSRARHSAALFTPDKAKLLQHDRPPRQRHLPSGERPAAADVVASKVNVVEALRAKEAPSDPRLRQWWHTAQAWAKQRLQQAPWMALRERWDRFRHFANPQRNLAPGLGQRPDSP